MRFAPGVRICAIRDGALVSTASGCFRLGTSSATSLVSKLIPALYCKQGPFARDTAPELLLSACGEQLEQAGIMEIGIPSNKAMPQSARVMASRTTPLALLALNRLVAAGLKLSESASDNPFVITDLSGLDTSACLDIIKKVFQSGCRSLSIWKRGAETFYGPIAKARATACWNCCRLRFADSLDGSNIGVVDDEEEGSRVIAENVLLAIRYPDIAGYGCVVADAGRTSSLHSVVPMPWCEVCGGVVDASQLVRLTHSVHVPENLRVLADRRGGIVRQLFIFDNDGLDTPTVPSCCSVEIAPFRDERISNPGTNGEGKGATRDEALRSAVCEGLERYAASLWHPSTLINASLRELGHRAFDPRWLVLYNEAQHARKDFAYAPFDAKRRIYWTTGQWLDSTEPVSIPALAAYLNFPAEPAERFCQTTSNGLAAGDSFEDAALRALYELIERDAFMLSWLSRRSGLRINVAGCDELTREGLREVERLGARTEVFLLDVGTQHPTVVCLGLGDGRAWPGATIGLGTHADSDIALRKAVFEHNHYGAYMRRLMQEGRHRDVQASSDVLGSMDHGLYYIDPDHVGALKFFRGSSGPTVSLDGMRSHYQKEAKVSACVSALLDIGIRTAAVDVTSSDVALAGIRVVRAFGVNMQPIHFGFGYERFKNPRLEALLSNNAETRPHPIA